MIKDGATAAIRPPPRQGTGSRSRSYSAKNRATTANPSPPTSKYKLRNRAGGDLSPTKANHSSPTSEYEFRSQAGSI